MIREEANRERFRRIVVRRAPSDPARGVLIAAGFRTRVALGRSGIARTKREGDDRTPAGRYRLLAVLYRPDRTPRPQTTLPVTPIERDMGWSDDPTDRNYNRPVRLPYPHRHERLWRSDETYDIVVILDFNLARPRPGAGSAIFMHVARPDLAPTQGCVALIARDLRRLLPRIARETMLIVE